MKARQLKNSILQMAVQGKLVPQNPNDEPASMLLEKIRAEKQPLIKEGKIRKDKNESVIYRATKGSGVDVSPYAFYERTTDGTVRDITDELPFDAPESWAWVRIRDIFNLQAGKFIQAQNVHQEFNDTRFPCYGGNGLRGYVDKYNRNGSYPLIGRQGALCGNINYADGRFYATEHAVVVEHFADMDVKLICYFLSALNLNRYSTATAQPGLAVSTINTVLFPLPPLAEQRRIVERIEQLLPHIDAYDTAEQRLTALNTVFPDQLKKSILQSAVQGKLVAQDPNDEPAGILLERIRAEREQLIRDGKIKRSKHESVIFRRDDSHYEIRNGAEVCIDDELPFNVPESWMWVRLRNVVYDLGQKKPTKEFCYIDVGSIDNVNGCLASDENIVKPENAPSRARKIVERDVVIYSTVRPYLLNICIIDKNFSKETIASTAFAVMKPIGDIYSRYLFYYLRSPAFVDYVNSAMIGVTYPAINDETLYKGLVPLPPLAEQRRIVDRLEELLPFISRCR